MNIILIKDQEDLGKAGDELEVKDGYARNYLIPKGYAVRATGQALKQLEKLREERKKQRELEIQSARDKADLLKKVSCTIEMETGEEDKMFGSVTAARIAEELAKEQVEIDKKQLLMESPFTSLGVYTVKVKLHPEVKTAFKVWVVKKQ